MDLAGVNGPPKRVLCYAMELSAVEKSERLLLGAWQKLQEALRQGDKRRERMARRMRNRGWNCQKRKRRHRMLVAGKDACT